MVIFLNHQIGRGEKNNGKMAVILRKNEQVAMGEDLHVPLKENLQVAGWFNLKSVVLQPWGSSYPWSSSLTFRPGCTVGPLLKGRPLFCFRYLFGVCIHRISIIMHILDKK